ncbi:MAG: hypothetical protein Kow0042_23180 [Calditrichia bacterium]
MEPLAAACEISEQIQILPEYRTLLIGDGKLAQLIARVLTLYTERLLVVGKHPAKLELLKKLGIPVMSLSQFEGHSQSYDLVVEATGSWEGWELALQRVRPRGFLVLKSTYVGEKAFNPAPLVINEITVIGSRCGPFSSALHLLRRKVIDPTDLITRILPFSEWQEAFQLAQQKESLKVILQF